jgi:hypothetical protein
LGAHGRRRSHGLDAAGRVVQDGERRLTWDAKGRLARVERGDVVEEYVYAHDATRAIKRTRPTGRPIHCATVAMRLPASTPRQMNAIGRSIGEQARLLPDEERLEVASEILALAEGDDAGAEGAREAEIDRRARRTLAGESEPADWAEVEARVRAVLERG